MWLLNTHTLKLETFPPNSIPPYAILSHTWEASEVSFQEWISLWQRQLSRHKADKIVQTCRLAREHGLEYAWIDTCCIDKTNNTELSEAINSMFRWYQKASVCYVYLCDLPGSTNFEDSLKACRWLKRGWTLQELIAPKNVEFYDASWNLRGSKIRYHALLASCTGIPSGVLSGHQQPDAYSVTTRMKWASSRETTRLEDSAYCLLGIFGVNIPLIYGEGSNAFYRLEEVVKRRHQHMPSLAYRSPNDQSLSATNFQNAHSRSYSPRVPSELSQSYRNWSQYPSNLIDKSTQADWVTIDPKVIDEITQACDQSKILPQLTISDLHVDQQNRRYTLVKSEAELVHLLGGQSDSVRTGDGRIREDPKSRLVFLTTSLATNSVLVSKHMLQRVLSYHQVPVQYLNLLSSAIRSQAPSDFEHGSFWSRQSLSNRVPGLDAPDISRSGRHYEMAFGLKGVESNKRVKSSPGNQWSVRNATVYHKFDIVHGTSLWLVSKTESSFEDQFDESWNCRKEGSDPLIITAAESFAATLESHAFLASWANESWLGYLRFLENAVIMETQTFVQSLVKPSASDLHKLQAIEDQIAEALATVNANHHVLQALETFYDGLLHSSKFTLASEVRHAFDDFAIQLRNSSQTSQSTMSRTNLILAYARERKGLMLQFMLAATSDTAAGIASMQKEDSRTMKILTGVTLILTPATFVSSLFAIPRDDTIAWDQVGTSNFFLQVFLLTSLTLGLVMICCFGRRWAAKLIRRPPRLWEYDEEDVRMKQS